MVKEIVGKNFPKLKIESYTQNQKAQTSKQNKQNRRTLRHIVIKMSKPKIEIESCE